MEKEGKNGAALGTDFLFQWGSRKRIRCAKVKGKKVPEKPSSAIENKTASPVDPRESPSLHLSRLSRNSDLAETLQSSESPKSLSASPDRQEDQERYYYATRASGLEDAGKMIGEGMEFVWPKFFISLSCKEKEEDFMAMKGCKLPQRPKKRAKLIQKCLQTVSPGSWLSELCQERYEVREKKNPKKRLRGLKAMGSVESDSE